MTLIARRACLAMMGGAIAAPAAAIEPTNWVGPLDQHGWRPAAAPPGAIGWEVLSATRGEERVINGFTWLVPNFPPQVRALNGRTVKIAGFMLPMQTAERQSRFLLTAYPPSCPFCLDVGPGFFIETLLRAPAAYTQDAILVEGALNLLERDDNGLFYRLTGARLVRS